MKKLILFSFALGTSFLFAQDQKTTTPSEVTSEVVSNVSSKPQLGFIVQPTQKRRSNVQHQDKVAAKGHSSQRKSRSDVAFIRPNSAREEESRPTMGRSKHAREKKSCYRPMHVTLEYNLLLTQALSPRGLIGFSQDPAPSTELRDQTVYQLDYNVHIGHRGMITAGFPNTRIEVQAMAQVLWDKNSTAGSGFSMAGPVAFYPALPSIAAILTDATSFAASMKYSNVQADLNIGYLLITLPRFVLKIYGGGSFLYFKNDFDVVYTDPTESFTYLSKSVFTGFGLNAGFLAKYFLARDFFFFSDVKIQSVVGKNRFSSSSLYTSDDGPVNFRNRYWDSKPGTHLKFGFAYEHRFKKWLIGANTAYEILNWQNITNTETTNRNGNTLVGLFPMDSSTDNFDAWIISFGVKLGF